MEARTPGGNDDGRPDLVQETLENLFSKKSLVKDQSLASHMNPQMYIPIAALLQHMKLQCVGATEATIVAAAQRSTKLDLDEQQAMIRPMLKSKRNVVVLQEVPEGTVQADIFELFVEAPHAELIASVKPDVNNTWFVKFNMEDTQDVVLWLREQQLKGQPVNAAIKSELRSSYPMQPGEGVPVPMPPGIQMGDQGAPIEQLLGGPMSMPFTMPMMMPPPPPPVQEGMQTAGYWQPWGHHHELPALIFTSSTTLSPECVPEGGWQEPSREFEDVCEDEGGGPAWAGKGWKGGRGKGGDKGSEWKGGKGKWKSGWSGQESGAKGWQSGWQEGGGRGKGWGGGKGSYSKGWQGGGKDWQGGGKDWYGGGKAVYAS